MIYNSNSNQSRACGANAAAMPFYQPMMQPMMAPQGVAQQPMMQPMMTQGVAQPMMQPMMASQGMAQPSMMAPQGMPQQTMMQPMMASQGVAQPMMQQPMMTSQGMPQQTMTQPNTADNMFSYDQNMTQPNYQSAMISAQSMPMASYPTYGAAPACGGQVAMPANQFVTTQTTQPAPMSQSQSTTAHHKKTTYVETYVQPGTNQVPVSTQKTTTMTQQQYPLSDNMIYTAQQQPKNSTMQDYNLYLLEKEYYGDDNTQPTSTTTYRDVTPVTEQNITCENLPLATSYVKMQPYTNLNDSATTFKQGTAFADLYDPYTPKRATARGGLWYE